MTDINKQYVARIVPATESYFVIPQISGAANSYVAEDGATFYVAEDNTTFYVQEA